MSFVLFCPLISLKCMQEKHGLTHGFLLETKKILHCWNDHWAVITMQTLYNAIPSYSVQIFTCLVAFNYTVNLWFSFSIRPFLFKNEEKVQPSENKSNNHNNNVWWATHSSHFHFNHCLTNQIQLSLRRGKVGSDWLGKLRIDYGNWSDKHNELNWSPK